MTDISYLDPELDKGSIYYTMKCGDTLSKIAKRFGFDLQELQKKNPTVNPHINYEGRQIQL